MTADDPLRLSILLILILCALLQLEWNPIKSLVTSLRNKYHSKAVFFYNEYCPDIVAVLWRPNAFIPENFSAMVSEFKQPVETPWKEDTLVVTNTDDLLHEIGYLSRDIVTDMMILDDKKPKNDNVDHAVKRQKLKE